MWVSLFQCSPTNWHKIRSYSCDEKTTRVIIWLYIGQTGFTHMYQAFHCTSAKLVSHTCIRHFIIHRPNWFHTHVSGISLYIGQTGFTHMYQAFHYSSLYIKDEFWWATDRCAFPDWNFKYCDEHLGYWRVLSSVETENLRTQKIPKFPKMLPFSMVVITHAPANE